MRILKGFQVPRIRNNRIVKIDYELKIPYLEEHFDGNEYYKNTIGVTVLNKEEPKEVVLKIDRSNAPYVLTKPMHPSQELLEELEDGVIIQLKVQFNFELERVILGHGASIIVLEPKRFRNRIQKLLKNASGHYED